MNLIDSFGKSEAVRLSSSMGRMRITFVTAAHTGREDTDLPRLLAAAERRGVDAEITVWDDPDVDWAAYDAVVIRSCWDYITRLEEFLAWADAVPRLHNPVEVLRWNTDKEYLRELQDAGVPIIETHWNAGPTSDIGDHEEWVVKPTVSSGSKGAARWSSREDALAHSADLQAAGRVSMTQPYIASVDDEGETAMLYFGGSFSHAIRKGPILARGEGVRDDRNGRGENVERTPTPAQHEVALRALSALETAVGQMPVYVRVDLVTGPDGGPLLIELEAAEPFLFLDVVEEAAADRLVAAVVAAA